MAIKMCEGTKFLAFLTILIFVQLPETPFAEPNKQCVPSTCGHIHNISYPFRLKTDPKHCGLKNYELICEGNHTILTTPSYIANGSMNYYVQAINYSNSTIRLVDPGVRDQVLCSLPQHSITRYTIPAHYATYKSYPSFIVTPITVFSCPFAMNSPVFVEVTDCFNRSYASNASSDLFTGHTYATMVELSPSDFRVGCSVDAMSMTSLHIQDGNNNPSTFDFHNALAFGFELSWFYDVYCGNCNYPNDCQGENSRDVRCVDMSCKVYNFGFFKTVCSKNVPDAMHARIYDTFSILYIKS